MKNEIVKLHKLEFIEENRNTSLYKRVTNTYEILLDKISYITIPRPLPGYRPVKLKSNNSNNKRFLTTAYSIFGIFSPFYKGDSSLFYNYVFQSLFKGSLKRPHKSHCRQIIRWNRRRKLFQILLALPTVFLIYLGAVLAFDYLSKMVVSDYSFLSGNAQKQAIIILVGTTLYLFAAVAVRTSHKIANAITLKSYADSICALTSAYIVITLSRDDVLLDSTKRTQLINRIDALARNTIALSWQFSSRSEIERQWSIDHFKYIERYIRERERWVITPMESTLEDLRKDFYELAKIYFYGNYGNFDWSKVKAPPIPTTTRLSQSFFSITPKFISIFLPVVLFGLLLWQQSRVENTVSVNIVALILISWFLLAIDAALKLGIVSGAVNLAKEIKSIK